MKHIKSTKPEKICIKCKSKFYLLYMGSKASCVSLSTVYHEL